MTQHFEGRGEMAVLESKRELVIPRRENGMKRRLLFVGISLASAFIAPTECYTGSIFSSVLARRPRDAKDSEALRVSTNHDSITGMKSVKRKRTTPKSRMESDSTNPSVLSSPLKTRLTKEEERHFLETFHKYNAAKNALRAKTGHLSVKDLDDLVKKGPAARDAIIQNNMGLVYFVVSKYYAFGKSGNNRAASTSLSYDDLVQEGVIGLATAIEKYDVAIAEQAKSSFGTYALFWIKARVLRALSSHEDLIRVPEHVTYSIRKIQSASKRMGLDLDLSDKNKSGILSICDPGHERALAVEAGLSVTQVREALRVARRRRHGGYISFEPWMQGKQSSILSDENDGVNQGYQQLVRDDVKKTIAQFLKPRELEALSLRYGLSPDSPTAGRDYQAEAEKDLFGESMPSAVGKERNGFKTVKQGRWGEAMSFKEIGKRMAVSTEYGRQLCTAALEKLREAAEDGELQLEYVGM